MNICALLCDHAEVSGGKLFINGAGVSLLATPTTEPPHPINVALAMVVTIPWTATNQQHRLTVELMYDAGDGPGRRIGLNDQLGPGQTEDDRGIIFALFNAGRAPHMVAGEETMMPVAIPLGGSPSTTWVLLFDIQIDGSSEARVSFRVLSPTQMPGFPGAGGFPQLG
jgi:hypothetical protein